MTRPFDDYEYRLTINEPIAVQQYVDGINYALGATMLMSVTVPNVCAGDYIEADAQLMINAHPVSYECVAGGGINMVTLTALNARDPSIWTWPLTAAENMLTTCRPYYVWHSKDVFRPTVNLGDCKLYTLHYAGSADPAWKVGDALQTMIGLGGNPTGRLTVKRWRQ